MNFQNKSQIIKSFDGFFVFSLEKALNIMSSERRDALTVTWRHHNENYGDTLMNFIAFQHTGKALACSTTNSGYQQYTDQSSILLIFREGNPRVTSGFPSTSASNSESVPMPWRLHYLIQAVCSLDGWNGRWDIIKEIQFLYLSLFMSCQSIWKASRHFSQVIIMQSCVCNMIEVK